MSIESINPATGQVIERFERTAPADVSRRLDVARGTFRMWRETSFAERSACMRAAATHLEANREEYAKTISLEMGKPIVEARAEIEKCAWNCRYYAEQAETFLRDEPTPSNAAESYVAYRPLGVVLAIMPWNFPFWQLFRFAVPSLMAGNTAVLKHASNVPACARAIERVFRESGFPDGAFTNFYLPGEAAEALIDDPRIAAVTLTGSEAVGMRVGRRAGAAIKKAVLELGGSDPFIVLADADVREAARIGVRARYQNAGQSCIAAKRFLVEKSVIGEFVEAFVEEARSLRVGDPLLEETRMGPLAREDLRESVSRQVSASLEMGATLALGGTRGASPGWFYAPTVVTGVRPEMPVFAEETFGPVAAIVAVADAQEAITLANRSEYGLGANVWTRDLDQARGMARHIESGTVAINGMVVSDPRLPFGGIKKSGYGRELSSVGIREFTNIQTVWIGPATTK